MKLTVKAVNFEIAQKLEKYLEKKTQKYNKSLPENAEMEFRLTVVKPETNLNKETQLRILGVGSELFAQKTCDTFEQGIDEVLEAVNRQIEKLKDR